MKIGTLTIVGVGLIGASIGLAARRRGICERIVGVGWRQSTLEEAQALGAIDEGFLDLVSGVCEADIVVFCTPVDRIVEQVLRAAPACDPGTLLTDAGSTKSQIVHGVEARLPSRVAFVGSHPLAGSEKRGPQHAEADLFRNRLTVVTKTERTSATALERTVAFWEALGSRVRLMGPEEHDRALAMTSHLPHLLASALAGILPVELADLTASGFRDTTRVAGGDPSLWTGIFMQNQAAVLAAIDQFSERLHQFQEALEAGDPLNLNLLLDHAKRVRDALGS